ncbi:hypothetical protein ACFWPY_35380 [Streptomyces sp. NPDC058527]|uniref:hypothetical protein n=1 Tax=Streptomyces sp. NPDC058527 TaxID=3346539 RepID=UPI0036650663
MPEPPVEEFRPEDAVVPAEGGGVDLLELVGDLAEFGHCFVLAAFEVVGLLRCRP